MTVNATLGPVELTHSWPLSQLQTRFEQGMTFDVPAVLAGIDEPPQTAIGYWSCRLADNELTWSSDIYRLFGLPDDVVPDRDTIVALYAEPSRAMMERLRAHAIRHRRGFTLDACINPAKGTRRWMRLTAAPIIERDRVTRLWGLKSDVTHLYS